jgi:two-component system phosphate regulon sensor histidine kinase PhoR
MIRSQFFWKLYASYALLVIVGVVAVGTLVSRKIADEVFAETEASLRARVTLLGELAAPVVESGGGPAFQAMIEELGRSTATRYTVMAPDGVVLADSDEDPSSMDNHGSRPEVLVAADSGVGVATRFSRTVAASMMYVAKAVPGPSGVVGYARAALPLTAVRERVAGIRWIVVLGGFLAAAAALGIGLFVTHRVTAPLTAMREVAVAIASGDYAQRVEARSQDEIGLLASAFNRMGGQLEDRMRTITEDRAKLLTILGGMVEGVVAVDRDRCVVHLNAAGGRILDVDPSASLGRPIWEVTRVRQVSEALDDAVAGSVEVTREAQLDIGAQERIVQLHAAPLVNGHDDQVGAVLVMHDVTELRRLERIRRDFVANVSHELKTPITAIRGLIDTIVDDADMPVDVRSQFLGKIQNQSLRLSSLVTDLLTLARLESTDGMLDTERVDLREVVGRSIGNFRSNAEAKSVMLGSTVPEGRVVVNGDVEALELLLNNLLDNAVKYTGDGGKVEVELRVEGREALLEVRDNGVGIGPEHHDRIFERFYRVDQARSRELGGTGLGLSIVKHVSKAHGGSVTLQSTFGAGSCFCVRLPLPSA